MFRFYRAAPPAISSSMMTCLAWAKRAVKNSLAVPERYDKSFFYEGSFDHLSVDSLYAERNASGWRSYVGVPIERKWSDIFTMEVLLVHARPRTIIELGTGSGAFSAYLAAWCYMSGARFFTFDTHRKGSATKRVNYRALALIRRLGGSFHARNVFAPSTVSRIARLANEPGVTLIYCDNGDKAMELRTYAPLLKEGDFLGVHDYGSEVFPADVAPLLDLFEPWNEAFCERARSSNRFFRVGDRGSS
jgi:cephalosporin hydroxylase